MAAFSDSNFLMLEERGRRIIDKGELVLSVVVPVYNEARTISRVVESVLQVPGLREILIVDDCSTDNSLPIITGLAEQDTRVRVFSHDKNLGKTAALRTGFSNSTGNIVIVQDADLEYDPREIPDVIDPILEGHADVVFGSRFMVKRSARVIYFYHYLANKGLTFLSNLFTNLNMSDIETCYKAFRGEIIRNMKITSSGFGFEVECVAKIAKLKCAVYEVPISYYGRTYEEGKKITSKDGIAALYYIIRFNLFCSLRQAFVALPAVSLKPGEAAENIQA